MVGIALKSALMKYVKSKEFISVFGDSGDWDKFSLGTLSIISDSWYVLSSYSKLGDWDGYEIRPTSEIQKFQAGGKYEKFIESIIDDTRDNEGRSSLSFPPGVSPVQFALNLSKEKRVPIQVWGSDSSISEIGVVDEVKEGVLWLRIVDRYGKFDAKMVMAVEEISAINIWSRELVALESSMQKMAEVIPM
ncbi:hypothetical protein ACEYYB_14880 [Paracoccus sp. p4-l81]|uniref:hypothetical protein n=1 Tax=Paracoccus sp. p4-l81 TaxID=3342806 RepID=UPI0035B8B080